MKGIYKLFVLVPILIAAVLSVSFSQDNTKLSKSTTDEIDEINIPAEVRAMLNNFFDGLKQNNVEIAFEDFLKNSPLKDRKEDIQNLKEQTTRAIKIYGKFYGAKYVSGNQASDFYLRLRYLGLYEKYPMRWIFTYYKSPVLGWVVTNIKLDDLSEFYLND
jgi:hypothetical protein